MDLSDRREEYESAGLDLADLAADPIEQFERWFHDAEAVDIWEPNAMVLSTTDADGTPSARYVLCKGFDQRGFLFFTSYESDKAVAIAANPRAALTFGWLPLRRQVRIVGPVSAVDEAESREYFVSRPPGSQLAAWASPQSRVVADRAELERLFAAAGDRLAGGDPPLPPHWGGYRVRHEQVEFWQGRPNRFHDRLRYRRAGEGWTIERLAP